MGDPADWPADVGSVAYEAADAFLLVDPLVPDDLWSVLAERIERHGRPVVVLTTIGFHRRSRDEVLRRFEATAVRRAAELPEGVETIRIPRAGETMVWLPGPRALVPGDRLLGDERTDAPAAGRGDQRHDSHPRGASVGRGRDAHWGAPREAS